MLSASGFTISIHSLRAERDPATGADLSPIRISIHSLRAERDAIPTSFARSMLHFNPLAPCGARLIDEVNIFNCFRFQSTRSVRSETLF